MKQEDVIRILIADDHPVVREGIAAVVERQADMTVIAQARNGEEAVALFDPHRPDVTLMDLSMPVMDGQTAISRIRERFPDAKILVLTTYDGDESIYQGLRAGARGYLLKDAPREELLGAIRNVYSGGKSIPPEVAAKLAERLSSRELTPREMEVLRLMARGKTNLQIGNALFIAEGTVKAHVNSILNKLHVSDRTQAITTALRRGLVSLSSATSSAG